MIQFNTLKFVGDTNLQIDIQVMDCTCFEAVVIDSIIIDTEDTVTSTGMPSDNPVFTLDIVNTKHYQNMIDVSSIKDVQNKMLFVYAKADGNPDPNSPCGTDNIYSLCAVINYAKIYDWALKLARCTKACGCIGKNCDIDVNFANFALQYFQLAAALDNKDWQTAYKMFCRLTKKKGPKKPSAIPEYTPCNCHD